MSGGGGGPIIINNLIENPSTTAEDKAVLREVLQRIRVAGSCTRMDAWKVALLVYSVLRRD